jgi:hypothetical protein
MPFYYLRVSLVALVASAVAVSAIPGLTVKTSIPNVHVDGLQNLKVTATITNIGDEILKLLNDPRGVLDAFPEDSFNITDATGLHPSFNGAKASCASGHPISTRVHTLVSTSRSSTAPPTPPALRTKCPGYSRFSFLELPSMSLMIVSASLLAWVLSHA